MIDANDIPSSQLILYADDGYDSHVVRLLLEEKKLAYYLSRLHSERPEDLTELNPYHTLPVLQQREIALYEINVIFEYLEERYHTNKLLPDTRKSVPNFASWLGVFSMIGWYSVSVYSCTLIALIKHKLLLRKNS